MDWFYKMGEKNRIILTVLCWTVCIFSSILEILVLYVILLIPSVIFTFLTAYAHDKEKKESERKAAEEKAARERRFEEMQKHQSAPRSLEDISQENRILSAQLEAIGAKINEAEQSGGKYLSQKERQDLSDNLEYILKRVDELKQEAARAESSQAKPEFSIQFNPGSVNFPIYTKVKGVTFENRQAHLAESQNGDILIVRHAPLPKFPNAVEIVNQRTGKQLGFIGAELAQELIDEFGEGCSFNSEITEITGGSEDKSTLGCNLVIYGFAD